MKHFIFLLSILFSIQIQAHTYEVTIGKNEVFLKIDLNNYGDRVTAHYFYKSQLQNIPLEGSFKITV